MKELDVVLGNSLKSIWQKAKFKQLTIQWFRDRETMAELQTNKLTKEVLK